jgi:hypothetical protein
MVTGIEINRGIEFHVNVVKRFFNFKFVFSPDKAVQIGCIGIQEKGYGLKWHLRFLPSILVNQQITKQALFYFGNFLAIPG